MLTRGIQAVLCQRPQLIFKNYKHILAPVHVTSITDDRNQFTCHVHPKRLASTKELHPEQSIFQRFKSALGLRPGYKYSKWQLDNASRRLYMCCVELVDQDVFFKETNLPDTFNSWFQITELHIWMCLLRLSEEGPEGKFCRDAVVTYMWKDLEQRLKKLGPNASMTNRKEGISELSSQFRGALFAYDEGVIGDDKMLAGTVWRTFFQQRCDDIEQIELIVHYIRKQLCYIDQQSSETIVGNGLLKLLPLDSDKLDEKRTRRILANIVERTKY